MAEEAMTLQWLKMKLDKFIINMWCKVSAALAFNHWNS